MKKLKLNFKAHNIFEGDATIGVEGSFNSYEALRAKESILNWIDLAPNTIQMDLLKANELDLTALNILSVAYKKCKDLNKSFSIKASGNSKIASLASLTKMDRIIPFSFV